MEKTLEAPFPLSPQRHSDTVRTVVAVKHIRQKHCPNMVPQHSRLSNRVIGSQFFSPVQCVKRKNMPEQLFPFLFEKSRRFMEFSNENIDY